MAVQRLLLVCLFLMGPFAAASAEPRPHFPGLDANQHHMLKSVELQRPFHVFVRLPETYSAEPTKQYPTIYVLDGAYMFPMLASYYRYLTFGQAVEDIIIVGIFYDSPNQREGNFRGTDFTAPAASQARYGGAGKFQSFLKKELLPYMEQQYRMDTNKRIIFGQSLGGQFVLYTAQTDPALFWGHIASNPALHRNLSYFLTPIARAEGVKARLFVSSGEREAARYRVPALAWMKHWQEQKDLPWGLKTTTLVGQNHFSAAPEAFRQGLQWLFQPLRAAEK